jgi:hypothetical protein
VALESFAILTSVWLFRFIQIRASISWRSSGIGEVIACVKGIISLFILFSSSAFVCSLCAENQALRSFLQFLPHRFSGAGFCCVPSMCGLLTCAAQNHENRVPSSNTRIAQISLSATVFGAFPFKVARSFSSQKSSYPGSSAPKSFMARSSSRRRFSALANIHSSQVNLFIVRL